MLKGYRCPPGGESPGRPNEISYCLGSCQKPCVAPPLLAAMYQADTQNYHNDHTYLSASMLAGNNCARAVRWERTTDFYSVPIKRYWPFRGTHAHSICEGAHGLIAGYGWLQELRMSTTLDYPDLPAPIFNEHRQVLSEEEYMARCRAVEVQTRVDLEDFAAEHKAPFTAEELVTVVARAVAEVPREIVTYEFSGDFKDDECLQITLRGTADGYNPWTRQLADMKSMADTKADMTIKGTKGGSFSKNLQDEHVWQFNIYRWLIARNRIPDWVRERGDAFGLPKLKGKSFPAPRELIMQGIGMMQIPRSGGTYGITYRGATTLYEIDPVPVLPLHEIEEFVRPKALYWYRALVLGMPIEVLPAEKKWMCASCAFNGEVIEGERCFPDAERKAQAK